MISQARRTERVSPVRSSVSKTLRCEAAGGPILARIAIEITDNGPGIPADLQDRIFYPLVSGREGGSGLGLTLAQNFINQHHGVVSFESVPGSTTFEILLPVEENGNGK
jgi:nitrogen-specific signal transduction histidine kinase